MKRYISISFVLIFVVSITTYAARMEQFPAGIETANIIATKINSIRYANPDVADHSDDGIARSIASEIASIGTDHGIIELEGNTTYIFDSDLSVPGNVVIVFQSGAKIGPADTKTITFDNPGQIEALPTQQIFTGSGLIDFTHPGTIYPDWWQANTQGTTDMTPAINKAMIAGGAKSTLQLNAGTYLIQTISKCEDLPACNQDAFLENYFVNLLDDRVIKGKGMFSTEIKVADHIYDQPNDDTSNAHVFQGFDIDNVVIRDLQINMNGYNNLTPPGKTRNSMAIRLDDGGSNVLIENIYVLNNPGHNNIVANNTSLASKATGLTINNCLMYGGGLGVPGNINNSDFSFIYSEWEHTLVTNNRMQQPELGDGWSGGIELHRSWSEASNNIITYCDPGVWIASGDQTGAVDIEHIAVTSNVMEDCVRGVAFWVAGLIKDVTIANNSIKTMRRADNNDIYGVEVITRTSGAWNDANAAGGPIYNINIVDNIFTGEDNATRNTVWGGVGVMVTSVHGMNIKGNTFNNIIGDGVLILGSPYGVSDVVIQDNYFKNWGRGKSGYGTNAIFADFSTNEASSWDTSAYVPDAGKFVLRRMTIEGNVFQKDDNTTNSGGDVVTSYIYALNGKDAYTAGQMIDVEIRNNVDWLCEDTITSIFGGNLGVDYGARFGIHYQHTRDWIATTNPSTSGHEPYRTDFPAGSIGWNRSHLGITAGVGVGRPVGWINVGDSTNQNYEPFGVIGQGKAGTYANRPSNISTELAVVYYCTDCTRCDTSGNPTPIWWISLVDGNTTDNHWYCDNRTNGIIEAGIE